MMPHGMCLMWNADLMALHIVADSTIAFACYFIAGGLVRLTRHRILGDVVGHGVSFGMAGLFIGCGSIQFFDIITLWKSWYWVDAGLKVFTAVVAAATASIFYPVAKHYLGGFFNVRR